MDREYQNSIKRVLDALKMPDLFDQCPKSFKLAFRYLRMRGIRIEPAEGENISPRIMKKVRYWKSVTTRLISLPIMPGYDKVCLEDYLTAGTALAYLGMNDDPHDPATQKACEKLKPFVDFYRTTREHEILIRVVAVHIGQIISRINGSMYYLKTQPFTDTIDDARTTRKLGVYRVKPIQKKIKINGKPRPVYRVGLPWAERGIMWLKLTPGQLKIRCCCPDLPLDVYIQSHAVIRFRERMDTLLQSELHRTLFESLKDGASIALWRDRALIEYHHTGKKLGYFVVEVVEGVVVVLTFLFITNSGCPEGDRLDRVLAVGKMEKQFAHLDRLSTFLRTDLCDDQQIRAVMQKVGLDYLLDLDPDRYLISNEKRTGYAADFKNYMLYNEKYQY